MSDTKALVRRRYRLLLDQLFAEWKADHGGSDHGFKTDAGKRLGISAQYVGMIMDGTRAEAAPVEEAVKGLRLDSAFFYNPKLGDSPNYRDFIQGTRVERNRPEMPAVTAYFAKHPEHERFRDKVNDTLHSSTGDVSYKIVRAVVREMVDEEEAA